MQVTRVIDSWLRARSEGVGAAAMIEAQRGAAQSSALARERRERAERQQLDQLRQAADRLRAAARSQVAGAVLQGTCGLGAAVCGWARIGSDQSAGRGLEAGARLADGMARAEPFKAAAALREGERAGHELTAKRAEQAAGQAADQLREAERLSASYLQRLQALIEATHAAGLALVQR